MSNRSNRLFRIWEGMRYRCTCPSMSTYTYYGAKGITVCSEWETFINFEEWALANGYNDELSIDRKDNGGNYEPYNCRWATRSQQNLNRRNRTISRNAGTNNPNSKLNTHDIHEIRKDERTHSQIARDYKVSRTTIGNIKRGTSYVKM